MKKLPIIILSICSFLTAQAQEFKKCAADEIYHQHLISNPGLLQSRNEIEAHTKAFIQNYNPNNAQRAIITIPVVFHIVYRNATQNISDAQILSQIEVLNEDFRLLNPNFEAYTPSVFQTLAADFEIEFCLATIDPSGNPTNGINRVSTNDNGFDTDDQIKFTAQGGTNAWPSDRYLNIWVGDLNNLLGYAQFPGDAAETDGVVLTYTCIGRPPANPFNNPYNLGRTATHEIGHWLSLYHIWGNQDSGCNTGGNGTDEVSDTPVQDDENSGCPNHPNPSCNNGGDMFMNYMDYIFDECVTMFTEGQKERALAIFSPGGERASLLTSNGCGTVVVPPTPTCLDTLNFPMPGTEAVLEINSANQSGFVSGTNSYGDKGKYSKFTEIGGNNILTGCFFKFGFASLNNAPSNTEIAVKVYDATGANGTPGAVLATGTIPFGLIEQTINDGVYVLLTFNSALTVSNDFFIGIDLNTSLGYDLALFTNLNNEGEYGNTAWEQWNDNSWHDYPDAWNINVDHAIHPIMGAPSPVASFNINDNSICTGQTVTYTATGGGIGQYNLSFPGGSPSASTSASQIVSYPNSGSFSATLLVIGACNGESLTQTNTNLLTVSDLPAVPTITISGAQLISSSSTGNQWIRNGIFVNGATAQTFTPTQNGNYTLRVTSNGCSAVSSAVNVNFVGIDYLVTNNVQIFPNPANDELFIQPGFEKTESSIQCMLFDLGGKMALNKTFNNVLPTQTLSISTSNLSAGVYQLVLQTNKDRITRKVAIAR